MKALGLNRTAVRQEAPKPKEASSLNATNLKVFLCVIAILAAVAAVCVWQMNVGGTGNWITFTLTGVSGALLVGVAIETMIASCKSRSKPAAKPSREKQAPSMLPKPTPKLTAEELRNEQAVESFFRSGNLGSLKSAGLTPFSIYQGSPVVIKAIYEGLRPDFIETMLKDCTLEEFSQCYPHLSSLFSTHPDLIASFAERFYFLVSALCTSNQPLLSKYLPPNGVRLVEDRLLSNCINARADRTLASILPNFAKLIDLQLFDNYHQPSANSDDNQKLAIVRQAILAYNNILQTALCEKLRKVCQTGSATDIYNSMLDLRLGDPRTPLPSEPSTTVFYLVIESGRVQCLKEFMTCFETFKRDGVTPADVEFAKTCSKEVAAFLQATLEAQDKRKAELLCQMAELASKEPVRPQPPLSLVVAPSKAPPNDPLFDLLLKSSIARDDIIPTGPYQGKTVLQVAVEANAIQNLRTIIRKTGDKKVSTTQFFLGHCDSGIVWELQAISTSRFEELDAQFKKHFYLNQCAQLVQDDSNKEHVLHTMREYGVTPDMTLPDGKTLLQHTAEAKASETLKAMITMLNGKKIVSRKEFESWAVSVNDAQELETIILDEGAAI